MTKIKKLYSYTIKRDRARNNGFSAEITCSEPGFNPYRICRATFASRSSAQNYVNAWIDYLRFRGPYPGKRPTNSY